MMLPGRPHKRRPRSLIALRLRKADFLAFVQDVETAIRDAVAMKVDFAAIAARDDAVICLGMKLRYDAVRRDLVFLNVTSPLADNVLKLASRGLKGIADTHVNVLMGPGRGGFAADYDIGGIRDNDMNPDMVDVAFVMTVLRPSDDHSCADDPLEKLLKLASLLSDSCLNSIGMLNAFERDFQWNFHGENLQANGGSGMGSVTSVRNSLRVQPRRAQAAWPAG